MHHDHPYIVPLCGVEFALHGDDARLPLLAVSVLLILLDRYFPPRALGEGLSVSRARVRPPLVAAVVMATPSPRARPPRPRPRPHDTHYVDARKHVVDRPVFI